MNTQIDLTAALMDLQIKEGPYTGGFEIAPHGMLNWYFTNLGLANMVACLTVDNARALVLPYMKLYISKLKSNMTIDDVAFPRGRFDREYFVLQNSDSDDSYAATFFSLVYMYTLHTHDSEFVKDNFGVLVDMYMRNIVFNRKDSGLVRVFQFPRGESYDVAFLMDNCEVLKGISDLLRLARCAGISSIDFERGIFGVMDGIGAGLKKLYVKQNKAFKVADGNSDALNKTFYPGCTSQVFMQLNGVTVQGLNAYWARGFSFLNKHAPGWETGGYDAYPWACLGTVAALRGRTAQPQIQLKNIERLFINDRRFVTINELGFYSLTQQILAMRANYRA